MPEIKIIGKGHCEICDEEKDDIREISGAYFIIGVCGGCLECEQE